MTDKRSAPAPPPPGYYTDEDYAAMKQAIATHARIRDELGPCSAFTRVLWRLGLWKPWWR